jgi:uncharacterized Ntn-hydrolase superfamily protein
MTFSIVARCPDTGRHGVAISTAIPAVGALCPAVAADVGAVTSQAWVNPQLRADAITGLRQGRSAAHVLEPLLGNDPGRQQRQVAIVDAHRAAVAFTGRECVPWAGHLTGDGYAVQGNMLVSRDTVTAMERTWLDRVGADLPERLVACLEAGQAAGGDLRGRQSAAIVVTETAEHPAVDLRVDEHPDPVRELRRVWEVARVQLLPFLRILPTRDRPAGGSDDAVTEMLMRAPSERPGR